MKLTPNQCDVLAVLASRDGMITAEVVARSGRRYVPGVVRVLESLRGDGLVCVLDGYAIRRWRITEAGQSALNRYRHLRKSVPSSARASHSARPVCPRMPVS
jgi:hypothetical protein